MKLRSFRLYAVDQPFRKRFRTHLIEKKVAENIYLRVETAEGLVGWAEGNPHPVITRETREKCWAGLKDLCGQLVGRQFHQVADLDERLSRYRGSHPTAAMMVDMALHDLAAQQLGVPLYQLFARSASTTLQTDITLSLETPKVMAAAAEEYAAQGFSSFKMKVGSATEDVKRVAAVRRAVGPEAQLKLDANQGWDDELAMQMLTAMAPYQVAFCEQPVPQDQVEVMLQIHAESPIAIMADESLRSLTDALVLSQLSSGCHWNIKAAKSGGLLPAWQIARMAEQAGVRCQLGCMTEGALAMTAFAHLAVACPAVEWYDLDAPLLLHEGPCLGGVTYDRGGQMRLPTGPGLGAAGDEKALASVPQERITRK